MVGSFSLTFNNNSTTSVRCTISSLTTLCHACIFNALNQ
ncbi:uncharacterized protein FFB20_06017 [Fusarium fujikuroi]|nr:uncharacterized protein FFB20_06017 [Fusarium fujikuroi]SCN83204.1 uncharacterized protein FFC1_04152 [Fusarium fujikuroi]SCN86660.1 uncharacterized protein FFM5_03978 [Fusarium fujikuroi]SCO35308.1 uncharacterized protein FFNC_04350 [Fusarium fujikuroi]SCO49985.1 uncharacterized protein FFMR_09965 [Fusarium fujikuroi]